MYGIDDLAPRSLHKKARSPVIAIDGAESDDDSGDDSGTAMKEADAELAAVGEFDALASSTKFDAVLSQLRHSDRCVLLQCASDVSALISPCCRVSVVLYLQICCRMRAILADMLQM